MNKPMAQGDAAPAAPALARRTAGQSAPVTEDWIEDVRRVIQQQIEQIIMNPSKNKAVLNRRARDARTLDELVTTLSKLDAADKRREGKGRKAQPRDDSSVREEFIRRLDQLLAARGALAIPGKPDPERG